MLLDPFPLRIAFLWCAWLLLMLFHVELGLMPLFHGCSVEIKSRVAATQLPRIFFAMLVYFLIPLAAMLLAIQGLAESESWTTSLLVRRLQFWLAIVYSLTNIGHLIADMRIPDSRLDQVLLMAVLTIIGALLCWQTFQWAHQ